MEDLIYMVIGVVMYYSWIHSVVIIVRKISGTTPYEKVVMSVALGAFTLYLIGTM